MTTGSRKLKLGLALGSGSARGWSHIGVIRALEERGLAPDVVAGTSIGALVGGAYTSGHLDELADWVSTLDRMDIIRLMDARLSGGGFLRGERLMNAIAKRVEDVSLDELPKGFASVATDLASGREVWIRDGSLLESVRASIALPGVFAPTLWDGHWLIDGGLVNPVPVSLCRALGADLVLAVNLNDDLVGPHFDPVQPEGHPEEPGTDSGISRLLARLRVGLKVRIESLISGARKDSERKTPEEPPGLFDVLAASINIMQDRITRSRMAGDPPELVFSPRAGHIELMEFHRAPEAIEAGHECVARNEEQLEDLRRRLDLRGGTLETKGGG